MYKPFAAGALLLALVLAAPPAQAALPRTTFVHVANFAFSPALVTIAPGESVTWINDDDDAHSIVADAGGFHSPALDTKDHYSFSFTSPGAFAYHCGLHPHMVAKVVVRP